MVQRKSEVAESLVVHQSPVANVLLILTVYLCPFILLDQRYETVVNIC